MGANFHTDWADNTTDFTAASMNPALQALDKGITYQKNVILYTVGTLTYVTSTRVLAWASPLVIVFTRDDGNSCVNTVAAGSITITAGNVIYLDLNETNNTALTMAQVAVPTGGVASTMKAVNRVALAICAATSSKLFPVHPSMSAVAVS